MAGRNNPDPAEQNAFFPSKESLAGASQTTNYDGPSKPAPARDVTGRILMIGTDERYLPIKGGLYFSTGNHPVETLLPLLHLEAAGFQTDVATLSGNLVKFEHWAFPREDAAVAGIYQRMGEAFHKPQRLREVIDAGLDKYDAVFFPGGHGAMNGLPKSRDVQEVLQWVQDRERTLIAICHGPAAIAAGSLDDAVNPFKGYEIATYPDAVDAGPSVSSGYLPGDMEWFVGRELVSQGLSVINIDQPATGLTHRDRNLLSGDSPQAANALGKLAAEYLTHRAAKTG